MAHLQYRIELDGEPVDEEFYGAVLSLTAIENTATASSLRLRLRISLGDQGAWSLVEDERLSLFQRIKVSIGFAGGKGLEGALQGFAGGNDPLAPVFEGYVTTLAPSFDSHPSNSVLEVQALDTSVLMNLEDKIATWPDLSDGDIAEKILSRYGVEMNVDATQTMHLENDTTVTQRGTDLQFLRTLAQRNGMEFYFETDAESGEVTAYFRAPRLDDKPQPDLAVRFGADETNLRSFSARLTGQRPLSVRAQQIDVKSKSANAAQANQMQRTKLGDLDLKDLEGNVVEQLSAPQDTAGQMLLLGSPTSDSTELQILTQAVRDEAGWCIHAQGEINGDAYQHVLRPHRLALVKGAGRAYSGKYYVIRVVHELTGDGGYLQRFEALRNARDLDGSETFGGTNLALAAFGI